MNTVNKECDCLDARSDAFKRISGDVLIKRITEYFDEVILIECATGKVLNISDRIRTNKTAKLYAGLSYDEQLAGTMADVLPETERISYEKAMLLSTVIKRLKLNNRYEIELFSHEKENGKTICKRITYSFYDEQQDMVVMVCQDVTSIISGDIDPLTELYNSSGLYKRVNKWIKENPNRKYRVQRYDIDHFRDINGIYGFDAGNRLLSDFGKHMKSFDSPDSFSAHISADHFVRFCADDVVTAEECYDNFSSCFDDYDLSIPIKLHIGVYDLCEPDCDLFAMTYKALLALQLIKGDFSRRIAYYEKGMAVVETVQQELLADVQTAMDNGQFEVWFQPQVNYKRGCIVGVEALLRWRHPQKGLLLPASFIPLMEKSGYVEQLDEYVIEKVCDYIKDWKSRDKNGVTVPVSVNISRRDIYNADLCERMLEILKKHGVDVSDIRLEITESAYMDNQKLFLEMINSFRKSGFRVEMDDFGSGYSSLNSLKDIDIDKLKIDMKFLVNMCDSKRSKIIISAVINMAKQLKLPVIAEGVEDKQTAEMLLKFGCEEMQGYYFSKPVPSAEYEKMLGLE